ncbi:hypothetical protein SAMD00019534_123840, partial [Acytostelium subglobosum LB1]|uniref:hypothetical protein n=1 Tax=Acytostelium subglobosum LB1 TaxID=1410327 RepID=UPI0006449C0A
YLKDKMSNNNKKEIPPFEDLSGPEAPNRRETHEQYLKRREVEEREGKEVFLREGIKGGLLYTAVTASVVAVGSLISPKFRKTLSWNIRTFIVSSGFVAGFWIWGETRSRDLIHSRIYRDMDNFYNKGELPNSNHITSTNNNNNTNSH